MIKPFFSLLVRIQFASAHIGKLMVLHESTHSVRTSWSIYITIPIDEKFYSVDRNRIFIMNKIIISKYFEISSQIELV